MLASVAGSGSRYVAAALGRHLCLVLLAHATGSTMGRPAGVLRDFGITQIDALLRKIRRLDKKRAISLERYFASMDKFFCELARITKKGGTVVSVIGNSTSCGIEVPTVRLIPLLATEHFHLRREFSYAIQNHYMQYGLRNGKGIREEWVLVFGRR